MVQQVAQKNGWSNTENTCHELIDTLDVNLCSIVAPAKMNSDSLTWRERQSLGVPQPEASFLKVGRPVSSKRADGCENTPPGA